MKLGRWIFNTAECLQRFDKRQWKITCSKCKSKYHKAKSYKCVNLPNPIPDYWLCKHCEISIDLQCLPYYPSKDHKNDPADQEVDKHEVPQEWTVFNQLKGVKICHCNLNSVRNKLEEVRDFLNCTKAHVFGVGETKLDPDRDTDNMLVIEGYNFIRKDRLYKGGGGLLLYIRNDIDHKEISVDVTKEERIIHSPLKEMNM